MQNKPKSHAQIVMKLFGAVRHDPRKKLLDFSGEPDSFVDSGSSRMLCHLNIGRKLKLRCACQMAALFSAEV